MGLSDRFDDPYYSGDAHGSPEKGVLPVTLDNRSYLIDTSRNTPMQERFRRTSLQLLNTQQNVDRGESALTPPEVWRRTYTSFHHGAGQKVADRANSGTDDSDPYRFDTSSGVDVWTKWQVSLLHDTARIATDGVKAGCVVDGHTVALSTDGQTLYATDGVLHASLALGTVSVIASSGDSLYTYGADDRLRVYSIANSGTAITFTGGTPLDCGLTETVSLLVFANYKLVACTTVGKVYDLSKMLGASPTTPPSPALTAVYEAPTDTMTWVAGCSGKKAIYLLSKSAVHAFDITRATDSGPLDVLLYSGVAAELPDGEDGTALASYLGYVAIGTSKGFRFAATGDGGKGLTYGPVIETPDPVLCFEGQDRFLYFGMSGVTGESGIGRADLSTFVADLQPAYAADLMSTGSHGGEATVFVNTMPDGKLLFGLSGGMWLEQDTYVDSGSVVLSSFTFNVVDEKSGIYATTQSSESGGMTTLEAYFDNSPTPVFLGNAVSETSVQHRFSLSGQRFNTVALQVTLESETDNTSTPIIYSVELRATYVRGKASEWQVPCLLSDEYEQDNGATQGRDVVSDFNHLMGLVETGRQFIYSEDGLLWNVYATDFIWSPHERSVILGWQGVFTIYFREVR